MGYAKEFDHECYTVPEFLFKNPAWVDVSWHNDVAPRWENYELMLAIWVDRDDAESRELEDWKRYTVCKVIKQGPDEFILEDGTQFETEDLNALQEWVATFGAIHYAEKAVDYLNLAVVPFTDVQDEMATVLAMLKEEFRLLQK